MFFTATQAHAEEVGEQPAAHSASKTPDEQVSDATTAPKNQFFSLEHREQIYEKSRLHHSTAALYSILPGLGNIYVEQYFVAGLAFTATAFSLVFIAFGLTSDRPDVAWAGTGLIGLTYVGAIGTSLYGVSQYNEKLRQGLKIGSSAPIPTPRGITLSFSF